MNKVIADRKNKYYHVGISILCLISFLLSCYESRVNTDYLHWGFMYAQALDILNGLIPHKQTLISYGYLTTLIQAASLVIFGVKLTSIGTITGIFYAASLYLTYRLFEKVVPGFYAFFASVLLFLIHPYAIYPWSNYFSHSFFLLSLYFLVSHKNNSAGFVFSGFLLGLSILCRYTSVVAVVPPVIFYFLMRLLVERHLLQNIVPQIALFLLGFIIPLLLFVGYLIANDALNDFMIQNRILIQSMGRNSGLDIVTVKNILYRILYAKTTIVHADIRAIVFQLNFIVGSMVFLILIYSIGLRKNNSNSAINLLLMCLVGLFGYLNSVHLYEVFRLVNGASVGFCVLVYCVYFIAKKFKDVAGVDEVIAASSLIVFVYLAATMLFVRTSSIYYPWRADQFEYPPHEGKIEHLSGKKLNTEHLEFYSEIHELLNDYKGSYSLVSYTRDSMAVIVSELPRIQRTTLYKSSLQSAFVDEIDKIEELVKRKKAVILSEQNHDFNDYQTVFSKTWPDDVPWLAALPDESGAMQKLTGNKLYIYVPAKNH